MQTTPTEPMEPSKQFCLNLNCKGLADALLQQVRRAAKRLCPLLVLTDGWAAYPGSIRRAFREKVKVLPGLGRASLHVWPDLYSGIVIKRTEKKRVVEITRTMAHGQLERAEQLLACSRGGEVLNTAFIERLNATFRERLSTLTRKSRHAAARLQALHMGMYLIGCTSKFLSRPSGTLQSETVGQGLYASDGQWPHRSCVEF